MLPEFAGFWRYGFWYVRAMNRELRLSAFAARHWARGDRLENGCGSPSAAASVLKCIVLRAQRRRAQDDKKGRVRGIPTLESQEPAIFRVGHPGKVRRGSQVSAERRGANFHPIEPKAGSMGISNLGYQRKCVPGRSVTLGKLGFCRVLFSPSLSSSRRYLAAFCRCTAVRYWLPGTRPQARGFRLEALGFRLSPFGSRTFAYMESHLAARLSLVAVRYSGAHAIVHSLVLFVQCGKERGRDRHF